MNKEINIDEILEKYIVTKKDGSYDVDYLELKDCKQAIKEILTETLQMAADKAEIKYIESEFDNDITIAFIDKDSITSLINKIKF